MLKGPKKITTDHRNYINSKNYLDTYVSIAGTDRSTNLFIKDYRVVAGCFPIDLKSKKILMIKHAKGGNFIIPRGGVEYDELRYKKEDSEKFQNFEKIPNAAYCFMEGGMRETWEEAGVKGKITKDLGHYYYCDSNNKNENYEAWIKRKKKMFPKSIEYYYQMEVDEVSEEWPEKGKRIQKWLELDQAVWHIVSNGRFSAFKALLKTDLVEDKNEFYKGYFESDLKEDAYKVFFRNKSYKKYSEEVSEACVVLVDIVLNKNRDKILVNENDKIKFQKVNMVDEPFIWRSSALFKWAKTKKIDEIKFISLQDPVGFVKKQNAEMVDSVDNLDLGTYKYAVTCCIYELDDKFEMNGRKWVNINDWRKNLDGIGKIVNGFLKKDDEDLAQEMEKMKI